jgi:hypothetical protein
VNIMRNVHEVARPGRARHGAAQGTLLAVALTGCLLFLAAQNTILLFLFGPSIEWPQWLDGVRVALNVLRVLAGVLLPWAAVAAAMFAAGAIAAWGAVRAYREVRHA